MKPDHYHLKVFFNQEASIVECLDFIQFLKTNALVDKTAICLGNKLDQETAILQRLRLAQTRLQREYHETSDLLEILHQRQFPRQEGKGDQQSLNAASPTN